jgi:excisionase family DNA binding protein
LQIVVIQGTFLNKPNVPYISGVYREQEKMNLQELRASNCAIVTRVEVGELFGCDPRTITQGIKDGTIPSIKLGRRVVIPREPLLALLTAPTSAVI